MDCRHWWQDWLCPFAPWQFLFLVLVWGVLVWDTGPGSLGFFNRGSACCFCFCCFCLSFLGLGEAVSLLGTDWLLLGGLILADLEGIFLISVDDMISRCFSLSLPRFLTPSLFFFETAELRRLIEPLISRPSSTHAQSIAGIKIVWEIRPPHYCYFIR